MAVDFGLADGIAGARNGIFTFRTSYRTPRRNNDSCSRPSCASSRRVPQNAWHSNPCTGKLFNG